MKIDFSDKFWSRVNVGDIKDCWEWAGGSNGNGYGACYYNRKVSMPHRIAAYLAGLIPTVAAPTDKKVKGFVLHKCDNKKCCNPYHFFIGSYADNVRDMINKGRQAALRGVNSPCAKLTGAQVKTIRRLFSKGLTQKAIALRYKLDPSTIHDIVRNKSYQ